MNHESQYHQPGAFAGGASQLAGAQNYYERKFAAMEERIRQLEKHIHYPGLATGARTASATELREAAARAQASVDTVPMRSDVEAILTMTAFCKRLLSPEDFAYAVTLEVRNEARRALGFKEREV